MAAPGAKAGTRQRSTAMIAGPKIGRPFLKQSLFDWSARDKYVKLRNFQMEVNNIIITYNTNNAEKLPIVMNWLCCEGLIFFQELTVNGQEK